MSGSFNHRSTADEVLDGIDLTGKRALVTGGASGIGVETVRALASKGAEVVIAARNTQQAEAAKASIVASTGITTSALWRWIWDPWRRSMRQQPNACSVSIVWTSS